MHLNPAIQKTLIAVLVILTAGVASRAATAFAQQPVAQGVMFWMDGCPHCHEVLENILPPLERRYGDQLDIRLIEVVTREDIEFLYEVAAAYSLSSDQVAVPFLIMGEEVLIGSDQIAQQLPGLIDRYLMVGGVDFPTLPGVEAGQVPGVPSTVEDIAPAVQPAAEPVAALDPPASEAAPATLRWRGFGLAIGIMAGMGIALVYTITAVIGGTLRGAPPPIPGWQQVAFPVLALAGLGVAGYLAYVETQSASAVCGPVGDCNAVQSSSYARLLGVLPIGVLGVIGYLVILGVWLWGQFGADRLSEQTPLLLFGVAVFGVLFSLYLTYLEPFVIGAVCAWCLTSAVIMTLLMLLTIRPVVYAMSKMEGEP